jgi:hypothetical protein
MAAWRRRLVVKAARGTRPTLWAVSPDPPFHTSSQIRCAPVAPERITREQMRIFAPYQGKVRPRGPKDQHKRRRGKLARGDDGSDRWPARSEATERRCPRSQDGPRSSPGATHRDARQGIRAVGDTRRLSALYVTRASVYVTRSNRRASCRGGAARGSRPNSPAQRGSTGGGHLASVRTAGKRDRRQRPPLARLAP